MCCLSYDTILCNTLLLLVFLNCYSTIEQSGTLINHHGIKNDFTITYNEIIGKHTRRKDHLEDRTKNAARSSAPSPKSDFRSSKLKTTINYKTRSPTLSDASVYPIKSFASIVNDDQYPSQTPTLLPSTNIPTHYRKSDSSQSIIPPSGKPSHELHPRYVGSSAGSESPSSLLSSLPLEYITNSPSFQPHSDNLSPQPTLLSTNRIPSLIPSSAPSSGTSALTTPPTLQSSYSPSTYPSTSNTPPTLQSSFSPSTYPSTSNTPPAVQPSFSPSTYPSTSNTSPAVQPSFSPSTKPSAATNLPTINPSSPLPSSTTKFTYFPTQHPSQGPTKLPAAVTSVPSKSPSYSPTFEPSASPSDEVRITLTHVPSTPPTLSPGLGSAHGQSFMGAPTLTPISGSSTPTANQEFSYRSLQNLTPLAFALVVMFPVAFIVFIAGTATRLGPDDKDDVQSIALSASLHELKSPPRQQQAGGGLDTADGHPPRSLNQWVESAFDTIHSTDAAIDDFEYNAR